MENRRKSFLRNLAAEEDDRDGMKKTLVVLAVVLLLTGCRKDHSASKHTALGSDGACTALPMADANVVLQSTTGGGFQGKTTTLQYFRDGTVTISPDSKKKKLSADRLARLDRELAATGVFAGPSGCWNLVEPHPDGTSQTFAIRHEGKVLQYGGDGTMPEPVNRARDLIRAIDAEATAASSPTE